MTRRNSNNSHRSLHWPVRSKQGAVPVFSARCPLPAARSMLSRRVFAASCPLPAASWLLSCPLPAASYLRGQ
jgi:hypothetical protein